ncbi:SRPBCC family protein [Geoalkalibacter sp.]|uniref:SRPBCC family protein n=1 Tax=Geoalkalibacter sp. TaxID=3041440 RepID=UPI00272E61F3|nr:SRPBCC family protein [Geoalkalibacter sp.]
MLRKLLILSSLLLVAFALMMATTGQVEFAVDHELRLAASPAQVWEVLADVDAWPHWWPGFVAARVTPALHAGARLDLALQGDPGKKPATIETVVAERKLSWVRGGVLGSTTRTSLRLDPVDEETLISMHSAIRGPQAFLARLTSQDKFTAYQQAVLEALRLRVSPEGRPVLPSASNP